MNKFLNGTKTILLLKQMEISELNNKEMVNATHIACPSSTEVTRLKLERCQSKSAISLILKNFQLEDNLGKWNLKLQCFSM